MKGKNGIITAAIVLGGMRLWLQLRGKTKTPFEEWFIGYGALFFVIALFSEASPGGASMFAWLVVLADFLENGESLTTDISSAIVQAEKPGSGSTQQLGSGTVGNQTASTPTQTTHPAPTPLNSSGILH